MTKKRESPKVIVQTTVWFPPNKRLLKEGIKTILWGDLEKTRRLYKGGKVLSQEYETSRGIQRTEWVELMNVEDFKL